MKFTLVYEGPLPSNARPKMKWAIRKYLSPQLEELWQIHPSLSDAQRRRFIPRDQPFSFGDIHHDSDDQRRFTQVGSDSDVDLCAEIERGGRNYWPLVRNTFALKCYLGITFMRREDPGKVVKGGDKGVDLDNRLKTLFDALGIPDANQVAKDMSIKDTSIKDPIYCLLEDDALIMGCNVQTHRLLARTGGDIDDVLLLIEVDVRVVRPRGYNLTFLGD